MRDDEQFPNSESNSDADIQHLNQESGRSEEDVLKTSLNRPEMVEVLDAPFDTAQSTVNKASTAEEKALAEDQKLKEHSGQEIEKTRAQLEKKALKREKWERKRQSVVPVCDFRGNFIGRGSNDTVCYCLLLSQFYGS